MAHKANVKSSITGAEMFTRMFSLCYMAVAIQLFASVPGSKAEVFAVGGAAGWTVPHKGIVNYTEWASMLSTLNVGDTLLFSYASGEHNVVQVGEEDFNKCKTARPIATYTDGQTLVNLPKEGRYWFICGFKGHCGQGQKFVIDVVNFATVRAPAPAPALSPESKPPSPIPEQGASAPSDGVQTSPSGVSPAPSTTVVPTSLASSFRGRGRHVALGVSTFLICLRLFRLNLA